MACGVLGPDYNWVASLNGGGKKFNAAVGEKGRGGTSFGDTTATSREITSACKITLIPLPRQPG